MSGRWFIEDDTADLFTRALFYKFQEEILASCLDMQIKRMTEEFGGFTCFEIKDIKVNDKLFKVSVSKNYVVCSYKKFVMCGIIYRHAFCGLKQIGVVRFSRSLVLNRWMKVAESGVSENSSLVSDDFFKLEHVSLKLTNIWFDFWHLVNKAGVQLDVLDHVHNTIKQLNSEGNSYCGSVATFTKKDHMATMLGQQPTGEITVLAPNILKKK